MYDPAKYFHRSSVQKGDSFIDGVSQEVGFSYSLFPELSHPESDQSFIRFVPESPLPQHSSKNPKNKKTKRVPDIAKTRRCSFTNPEAKERLNAAITAYNQIQKHGATYLVINGTMTEKITDVKVVCAPTKIRYNTLRNHITPGRIKKTSFGCGPRSLLGGATEQHIVEYI